MRKLFKMALSILMVFVLLLSLAACSGGKDSGGTGDGDGVSSTSEKGVGDGADDDGVEDGDEGETAKRKEKGMYVYDVAGNEVYCKNDIFSFIKDDTFDFEAMAIASGYEVIKGSSGKLVTLVAKKSISDGEIGVKLQTSHDEIEDSSGEKFTPVEGILVYNGSTWISQVLQNNPSASIYKEVSLCDRKCTIEQIILLEYALENMSDDINSFSFGNVLPDYEFSPGNCNIP